MILYLLACGGGTDVPSSGPESAPEPTTRPAPIVTKPFPVVQADPALAGKPVAPGGPVPIELQFDGVGDLHQRYFGDPAIVTQLATDLGACFKDRAVLRIAYDTEKRIGRIRLYADPATLTCRPGRTGDAVDLSALEPIGRGLAAYRDTVAGRFDYRVASFRIDLEALSGMHLCRLDLAGQFPPDGSTWSACVSLQGEQVCNGAPTDGVRALTLQPKKHADYLAACFR